MRTIFTMLATALLTVSVQAQTTDNQNIAERETVSFGAGFGFDYCGLGVGATIYPYKYVGVFANGGIFVAGPSYVVGLKGRYITNSLADPYLTVNYGYSGCVAVADEDNHIESNKSKIFRKVNIGFGADFHFTNSIGLTVGLTTNRAERDIERYREKLETEGYDFGNSMIFPFGFSVGIKWKLR